MIRATERDADVDRWLAIRSGLFPTILTTRSALDEQDRRGHEGKLPAGDVGFAIVAPPEPDDPHPWLTVGVLEGARGRINEEFGYERLPDLLQWEGPCSS